MRSIMLFRRLLSVSLLLTLFAVNSAVAADPLAELGLEPETSAAAPPPQMPRPASRIAENVTVITSEQIARLNAHTLTDILYTVTGIQVDSRRTPGGNQTSFVINSMDIQHILLLVDGVPQNDPTNNFADTSIIPAGYIERIEIIKGASSAAWGAALGGVVNVITKSPDSQRKAGGILSGSYGEHGTTDLNGEASGTVGRFGYYLQGGNLFSHGLKPGTEVNASNLFSKLSYNLPSSGIVTLSGSLFENFRGIEENAGLDFRDTDLNRIYAFNLNLRQPITPNLALFLAADGKNFSENTVLGQITSTPPFSDIWTKNQTHGSKAELNWKDSGNSLTLGGDYHHLKIRQNSSIFGIPDPDFDRRVDRYSLYLNGVSELGRLTVLPGIRFDHTGNSSDNVSYALGATFKLTDKTIARLYGGSGFGLPFLSPDVNNGELQKIWTAQAGLESSDLPYFWLKAALFYNRASNVEVPQYDNNGNFIGFTGHTEIRQGYELEAKSIPVYNLSIGAGYTWIDTYDRTDSSRQVSWSPTNSLKLTLDYKNAASGSSILLLGNYVWWNQPGQGADGPNHYKPITWDLHINQKLLPGNDISPELFFSGHNLFNGSQYAESLYKNAGRWVEGGVRFRF